MDEFISKYEAYRILKDCEAAYIYPPIKEAYATSARLIVEIDAADVISRKAILSDIKENILKGKSEHEDLAIMMLEMFKKYIEDFPGIDEHKEESE